MTLAIENIETCTCLKCDSAIPRENVARNIDPKTGIQTLKAFCPFCDALFVAKRRLSGSSWAIEGRVEQVTDPKAVAGMKARIDQLRGNMTIEPRKI